MQAGVCFALRKTSETSGLLLLKESAFVFPLARCPSSLETTAWQAEQRSPAARPPPAGADAGQ